MTLLIRPVRIDDLDYLTLFSQEAGYGFNSLSRKREKLEQQIFSSQEAFQNNRASNAETCYIFILEKKGTPIGTSAIVSNVGSTVPFYFYRLTPLSLFSNKLDIDRETQLLELTQERNNPTQVEGLFLQKEQRGSDCGKALSFSRFLFMASFPHLFASRVIAEMRGVCSPQGGAPFWEAIGSHFFQLGFDGAVLLRQGHPECVEELFPRHPIYVDLLPKEAQQVVSKTHPETTPALKILQGQGFTFSNQVDLFDGGPHLTAPTSEIKALSQSLKAVVKEIRTEAIASTKALISNERLDFRVTIDTVKPLGPSELALSSTTAQLLQVECGDTVRYLPL